METTTGLPPSLIAASLFAGTLFPGGLATAAETISSDGEAPSWQFSGSYRLRYENLDNSFRSSGEGSDQLLVSRLLAAIEGRGEHLFGAVEIEDSRSWADDAGTPLGTDDVNTVEPLQAYAGWRNGGDNPLAIKVGRMTLDLGSRRLLARNRFRNTLNAFTGVHADWQRGAWHWQGLYTSPVQRLPGAYSALDHNRRALDKSDDNTRFWALHLSREANNQPEMETYLFGLHEEDSPGRPTRDRDIRTLGLRLFEAPAAGRWDYELEAAYQFGRSHASSADSDRAPLDHRAAFVHAHLGRGFDDRLASRLVVQMDYASGDRDSNDGENNRFDTLFGARRFEFGPTGIYGAFARSNILSPGLRWTFKPGNHLSGFLGYRAIWLASSDDTLTTAGINGADGGRYAGQQLESRLRLQPTGRLKAEFGAAYLYKGALFGGDTGSDTVYWYSQLAYSFD